MPCINTRLYLSNFDHLDLTIILKTSSLDHFVTIKEQVYPELVQYFYSNLSFVNNHIKSRVKDVDINISLECCSRIFRLPCDDVEIFFSDLYDFEYPDGESALTASRLLHDNDNPALVKMRKWSATRFALRSSLRNFSIISCLNQENIVMLEIMPPCLSIAF